MRKKHTPESAQRLFGTNLRRLRKERELTQEALAELAGVHINYISSCERGVTNVSIRNIDKIARGLGVSMAVLVTESASSVRSKG